VADTIWTQADIDKLKAAVASGVLSVSYDGPPKRQVTYQSLRDMRDLLAEMRREVKGSESFRLAATSKGFGGRMVGNGGDI
jgi:hypothetical protein